MARVIEGKLVDPGGQFAIVAARFNELIVNRLVEGALGTFRRHGIDPDTRVDVVWVPGAFELPVACQAVAGSGRYAAICALGAVIRGDTPHFEHVAGEASKGVATVALAHKLPIIFGVLTTNSIEQAIERAGTKAGNAGAHAAASAIEMASLMGTLER